MCVQYMPTYRYTLSAKAAELVKISDICKFLCVFKIKTRNFEVKIKHFLQFGIKKAAERSLFVLR